MRERDTGPNLQRTLNLSANKYYYYHYSTVVNVCTKHKAVLYLKHREVRGDVDEGSLRVNVRNNGFRQPVSQPPVD